MRVASFISSCSDLFGIAGGSTTNWSEILRLHALNITSIANSCTVSLDGLGILIWFDDEMVLSFAVFVEMLVISGFMLFVLGL